MNYAIILASGEGKRINADIPKQFVKINGKTILEYTLSAFNKNKLTDRIILVTHKSYVDFCSKFKFEKLYKIIEGGKTRQDSSYNGVMEIKEDDAKVLIHDGARPFIKDELITKCYLALDKYKAINTGVETSDTIIRVDKNGIIKEVPERSTLLRCQTPQGFISGVIKSAHKIAKEKNLTVTDDTGLVMGIEDIYTVIGDIENIKITYNSDLEYAMKHLT